MGEPLAEALRRHVEHAPTGRIGVLVHVAEGANLAMLEHAGLVVARVVESISLVTGTMPADMAKLEELVRTPGVIEVEPDHEVSAQG